MGNSQYVDRSYTLYFLNPLFTKVKRTGELTVQQPNGRFFLLQPPLAACPKESDSKVKDRLSQFENRDVDEILHVQMSRMNEGVGVEGRIQ